MIDTTSPQGIDRDRPAPKRISNKSRAFLASLAFGTGLIFAGLKDAHDANQHSDRANEARSAGEMQIAFEEIEAESNNLRDSAAKVAVGLSAWAVGLIVNDGLLIKTRKNGSVPTQAIALNGQLYDGPEATKSGPAPVEVTDTQTIVPLTPQTPVTPNLPAPVFLGDTDAAFRRPQ